MASPGSPPADLLSVALDFAQTHSTTIAAVLAVYFVLVVVIVSQLLITPPYYAHRTPDQGLSKNGEKPIDSCWGAEVNNPKDDFGIDYKDVEFRSVGPKPVTLRGWHVPTAAKKTRSLSTREKIGIITVHGGGRDRREFHRHMPHFHKLGYEVLLFDYREHGISEGSGKGLTWGKTEYNDLLGAAKFAKEELGWTRVFSLGTSNGATFGILAASQDKDGVLDGVIAESAFATPHDAYVDVLNGFLKVFPLYSRYWTLLHFFRKPIAYMTEWRIGGIPLRAIDVVHKVSPRPLLLIHGTNDQTIHHSHSEKLFKKAREPKELWIAQDAWHTEVFDKYTDEYVNRIHKFIEEHSAKQ